ncbi:putative mitochondrial protein, partial [Mucuna pruriens]
MDSCCTFFMCPRKDYFESLNLKEVASQNQHDKTRLWHMRLGHVSEKGLLELVKQSLLNDDKIEKLEFYCILGKARRVSFIIGLHSTNKPFEYAHPYIWV